MTILLLFCHFGIQGQFTKSYLLGEYEEIVVPFTYANGFILVDVIFQRLLPLKFIVDTGAENSILLKKEYTDLLKTPYHKKIKLLTVLTSVMKLQHMYVMALICNF